MLEEREKFVFAKLEKRKGVGSEARGKIDVVGGGREVDTEIAVKAKRVRPLNW